MRKLRYGKRELELITPSSWKIIDLRVEKKDDLGRREDVLFNNLENPIGEKPFSLWLKDFQKVLIIVPDITRYAGVDLLLPPIFHRYLKNKEVEILFALGNHRKHTEEEKIEILTKDIYMEVPSYDHDCFLSSGLSFFGNTRSGIPVYLNSLLFNSQCAIVFGSINFHYLAGFGGGRKAIIPGIAGYETIIGVHKMVFAEKGRHPLARPGIMDGNPMHEEIMSGIRKVNKPLFLINTVVDEKEIVGLFCGNINYAHSFGCSWYLKRYSIKVEKKADVVVASAGGYPKDINFIQTHKTIEHAIGGVKKGGYMIVVGACEDGIGSDHFLKFFESKDIEEMEKVVRESDKVYSQTAYATRLKAEYCKIFLVSELPEAYVSKMGLIPKKSLNDAIKEVDDGSEKICYVLSDGAKILILGGKEDGM